jgi:hypothetical protein
MKTTTKHFSILTGIILFSCVALLQMSSQAHTASFSKSGNDSIKTTAASKVTPSMVTIPATVEVSSSVFDDPDYWVNYLENTVTPELQQYETPENVIAEMENNPTFWVDYLQKTIKEE